jgi:hypothetical protein
VNWFQRPGQPPKENVPADPRLHRGDADAIATARGEVAALTGWQPESVILMMRNCSFNLGLTRAG